MSPTCWCISKIIRNLIWFPNFVKRILCFRILVLFIFNSFRLGCFLFRGILANLVVLGGFYPLLRKGGMIHLVDLLCLGVYFAGFLHCWWSLGYRRGRNL